MKSILLAVKGFIVGIANIIPGVSGGTLAIILGIYEKLINILGSIWKNFVENLKFLLPIIIGAIIAIFAGAYAIDWGITNFPIATVMFFIGLIIGGLPLLYKNLHKKYNILNVFIFILVVSLVVAFSLLSKEKFISFNKINFLLIIKLFGVGAIAAGTMIIPGISGSLVLMNLGYYEGIISSLKGLTSVSTMGHSICVLLPFGIGVIIGLVLIARFLSYLFKRFKTQTYFAIFGFVLASIFGIIYQIKATFHIGEFLIGLLLLLIGATITFFLTRYDKTNKSEVLEEKINEETPIDNVL